MDHMANQIMEMMPEAFEQEDPRGREAPAYVMWRQRDGTLIRIVDMDDRHLYNTIRMLERTADARARRLNEEHDPSLPKYEVTRESTLSRPIYHALLAMAGARGIDLSEQRQENLRAEFTRRALAYKEFKRQSPASKK